MYSNLERVCGGGTQREAQCGLADAAVRRRQVVLPEEHHDWRQEQEKSLERQVIHLRCTLTDRFKVRTDHLVISDHRSLVFE